MMRHPGIGRAQRGPAMGTSEESAELTQETGPVPQAPSSSVIRGNGNGRGRPRGRTGEMVDAILRTLPPDFAKTADLSESFHYPLKVYANWFKVLNRPQWTAFKYIVELNPNVDSRRLCIRIVKESLPMKDTVCLFDGQFLYLMKKLEDENLSCRVLNPITREEVQLKFSFIEEFAPQSNSALQLLNVQFRAALPHIGLVQIGRRGFFFPRQAQQLGIGSLEIWPGFDSAINRVDGFEPVPSMMLCTHVTSKITNGLNALNWLKDIRRSLGPNANPQAAKERALNELLGCNVVTPYKYATYRVVDIKFDESPQSTFDRAGQQITYIEYYKKQYNMDIRDVNQPMLLAERGPRKEPVVAHLVPELCLIAGLTNEMRRDISVKQAIIRQSRMEPSQWKRRITEFIRTLTGTPEVLNGWRAWGMRVDPELVTVDARVIKPERIVVGGDKDGKPVEYENSDWTRGIRSERFFQQPSVSLDRSSWIAIAAEEDMQPMINFLKLVARVAEPMGMHIQSPQTDSLEANYHADALFRKLDNKVPFTSQIRFVFVVLPTDSVGRYDVLKKFCTDFRRPLGLASQAVMSSTIKRPSGLMAIATKVAIQMSSKLGALPWRVDIPMKKRLMVVGVDTTKSSNDNSVIFAISSSYNLTLTSYMCNSVAVPPDQYPDIKPLLRLAIREFRNHNENQLPELVVFYRDGASDGEMLHIRDTELQTLKKVLSEEASTPPGPTATAPEPTIRHVFVIVKRRTHTRFMAEGQRRGSGDVSNPPSGTVVDHVVTNPNWYDFFLVSQSVQNGTVTPTHYVVLEDTSGLRADHFQRFTYKLCHLYYNWPGTVTVPAPCLYARKLSKMIAEHTHTTDVARSLVVTPWQL